MEPEMIENVLVETETERTLRGKLAEAENIITRLYEETLEVNLVRCWYCGTTEAEVWHDEHQTPKSRGGTDNSRNIVTACRSCNLTKGAMTVQEFRDRFEVLHGTRLFHAERIGRVPVPDLPTSWHEVFIDDQLWQYIRVVAGTKGWSISRVVQWALFEFLERQTAGEDRKSQGPLL